MGEAIYTACIRKHPDQNNAISDCIEASEKGNPLTPLLGAWLFEDVFARLLPTSVHTSIPIFKWLSCERAACGFLSRGLWFEGEYGRVVEGFHEPLVEDALRTPWQPVPFFNSTWVETGDRAIASTVKIDEGPNVVSPFPAARDQVAALFPRRLSMVSAAHNSARFPFINSIGALRCGENAGCESPGQEKVQKDKIRSYPCGLHAQ